MLADHSWRLSDGLGVQERRTGASPARQTTASGPAGHRLEERRQPGRDRDLHGPPIRRQHKEKDEEQNGRGAMPPPCRLPRPCAVTTERPRPRARSRSRAAAPSSIRTAGTGEETATAGLRGEAGRRVHSFIRGLLLFRLAHPRTRTGTGKVLAFAASHGQSVRCSGHFRREYNATMPATA